MGTKTDFQARFDLSRIGPVGALIDGVTVNMTTGSYWHLDLATADPSASSAFATALTAVLTGLGSTVTVAYDAANVKYTLSKGGAFTIGSQTAAWQAILGTPPSGSSTSHVSTVRPYYMIRPLISGQSHYRRPRIAQGQVKTVVAQDGKSQFGISPTTFRQVASWVSPYNQAAPLYDGGTALAGGKGHGVSTTDATASMPWTWQHFYDHVRGEEMWAWADQTSPSSAASGDLYYFTEGAAVFDPQPDMGEDWTSFSFNIEGVYLGSQ